MLAKADEMDAQLIGQNRLIDDIAQDLIHGFQLPVWAKADIPERVQAQFYRRHALPPNHLHDRTIAPGRSERKAITAQALCRLQAKHIYKFECLYVM